MQNLKLHGKCSRKDKFLHVVILIISNIHICITVAIGWSRHMSFFFCVCVPRSGLVG
jgi:hypothetical protein